MCDGVATPQIVKETPATAYVNGRNGVGPVSTWSSGYGRRTLEYYCGCPPLNLSQVVGTFCMDLAMKKAKEVGVGWVTCTGMYYIGVCSSFVLQLSLFSLM